MQDWSHFIYNNLLLKTILLSIFTGKEAEEDKLLVPGHMARGTMWCWRIEITTKGWFNYFKLFLNVCYLEPVTL